MARGVPLGVKFPMMPSEFLDQLSDEAKLDSKEENPLLSSPESRRKIFLFSLSLSSFSL